MDNHHVWWENPWKSTISMVMFNSYVSHYQRVYPPVINPKLDFFQLATRGWHQRMDPMRSPNPIKSQGIPCKDPMQITIKSPLNHHQITIKSPCKSHQITIKSPSNHHYCKSHEILNSATGENSVSRMRFSPSTRMFHGITTRTSVDFDSDDESVMLGQAMSRCLRYFTLKNTQVGQIHEYHNIYIYMYTHHMNITYTHIHKVLHMLNF